MPITIKPRKIEWEIFSFRFCVNSQLYYWIVLRFNDIQTDRSKNHTLLLFKQSEGDNYYLYPEMIGYQQIGNMVLWLYPITLKINTRS